MSSMIRVLVFAAMAVFGMASMQPGTLTTYADSTTPTPAGTPPSEIRIVGAITAVDTTANTITINGVTVDISSFSDTSALAVGAIVSLKLQVNSSGILQAIEVQTRTQTALATPPADAGPQGGQSRQGNPLQPAGIQISGVVTALTSTTIAVNGLTIDITNVQLPANVAVGQYVFIVATADSSGILSTARVELRLRDRLREQESRPTMAGTPPARPTLSGTPPARPTMSGTMPAFGINRPNNDRPGGNAPGGNGAPNNGGPNNGDRPGGAPGGNGGNGLPGR